MAKKTVVQNEPTPIEAGNVTPEAAGVCRDIAVRVFDRVMAWHPLRVAAELAGNMMVAKMENADFFETKLALTEKQAEMVKCEISQVMAEAASAAVAKVKDYEANVDDFIGRVVIEELTRIPELTMQVIGAEVNRGALLAMMAVQAKATNEERDEIVMWKSKDTGDITIPTRGVFISTNVLEDMKDGLNFRGIDDVRREIA